MLQLHLSDQQFYCLLRRILYQRFYSRYTQSNQFVIHCSTWLKYMDLCTMCWYVRIISVKPRQIWWPHADVALKCISLNKKCLILFYFSMNFILVITSSSLELVRGCSLEWWGPNIFCRLMCHRVRSSQLYLAYPNVTSHTAYLIPIW